ncbi:protein rolling stone-like [Chironomus tepperi]|uniref:protein rolling stone-like n=1 Tax=Chironomus tepperi TaxID=113505 RepID=UPI00391F168A
MLIDSKRLNISLNHSDPRLFVTCQWQRDKNIPNRNYLIYRWIFALYFNFVVILSLITAEHDKNLVLYPIFLTNWNVILNGVSSLLSAIIVTQYFFKVTKIDNDLNYMPTSLKTSWLLSTLSTVFATSLSIIYWPLIYTGKDKGLNDALTHAVNAILLTIDLFINAHPPRYCHFVQNLFFGLCYALFSVIYTFCGGLNRSNEPFIYSVLNWKYETSSATLFAFLTLIFLILMHCVLTSCIHLRIWIHKKLCDRKLPKRANDDNGGINNTAYDV